jgi:hypothetical protein
MGNTQWFRIFVRKLEGNTQFESPYVGEEFRTSEMYHSHETFFQHSLRILVNIYSTSSITIKNKKEVTL